MPHIKGFFVAPGLQKPIIRLTMRVQKGKETKNLGGHFTYVNSFFLSYRIALLNTLAIKGQ